jgi:adenylate kinase family enzyme
VHVDDGLLPGPGGEARAVRDIRVLLIGGTSHVGKSTLAEALAAEIGWDRLSTDRLARHPGRPWATSSGAFPEHLATHYLSLSVDELATEQLRHYLRLWPRIEALVAEFLSRTQRYDRLVRNAVNRLGLPSVDTSTVSSTSELTKQCLQAIGRL